MLRKRFVSLLSGPWHCCPDGYFLPLLSKEGLTFSGRFAEAADFEYEDFVDDLAGLEGFLLITRDKMARVDAGGKHRQSTAFSACVDARLGEAQMGSD